MKINVNEVMNEVTILRTILIKLLITKILACAFIFILFSIIC